MISQGIQQSQRQMQGILLTPQLRQFLRILQLPTTELSQEINLALSANPLLELVEPETAELPDAPETPAGAVFTQNTDAGADAFGDADDGDPPLAPESRARRDNETADDYDDMLRKIDDDRSASFRDDRQPAHEHTPEDDEARQRMFDSAVGAPASLEASLLEQARLAAPNAEVLGALEVLIGELDERGFMPADIGTLCLQTTHSRAAFDTAWRLLKTFEPSGIGAADLRECFLIQLRERKLAHTLAALIVDDCFDLLLKRRLGDIARKLEVTPAEVSAALSLLATLDTAPARSFEVDENRVLNPDLTVRRAADGDGWEIHHDADSFPRLRINQTYKNLLAQASLKKDDAEYLREKMKDGRTFINAIELRKTTVVRVVQKLIEHQSAFFDKGPVALRPLTMAKIGKELGLHETTIGRAIVNKSLRTPHGTFELRYFFTSGFATDSGDEVTAGVIHKTVAEIVARENPRAPLSDEDICVELKKRGINIARRTITKHRAALNIPPTHLRKRE